MPYGWTNLAPISKLARRESRCKYPFTLSAKLQSNDNIRSRNAGFCKVFHRLGVALGQLTVRIIGHGFIFLLNHSRFRPAGFRTMQTVDSISGDGSVRAAALKSTPEKTSSDTHG